MQLILKKNLWKHLFGNNLTFTLIGISTGQKLQCIEEAWILTTQCLDNIGLSIMDYISGGLQIVTLRELVIVKDIIV